MDFDPFERVFQEPAISSSSVMTGKQELDVGQVSCPEDLAISLDQISSDIHLLQASRKSFCFIFGTTSEMDDKFSSSLLQNVTNGCPFCGYSKGKENLALGDFLQVPS